MSHEYARELANHEASQRDEYTSKIRFGLVALNAASLVTAATAGPQLPGVAVGNALLSAAFFFVGTVSGGVALTSHQTQLVSTAGKLRAWQSHLQRALTLADSMPGTPEYLRLGEAIGDAEKAVAEDVFPPGLRSITAQAISMWTWVSGVTTLGLGAIYSHWPAVQAALWCGN